jgi:PleD family two-component response regulator
MQDTLRPRSFGGIGCCKMPSEIDGVPAKVTASVGIASIEGDEADFAPAIARADAALYRAKQPVETA